MKGGHFNSAQERIWAVGTARCSQSQNHLLSPNISLRRIKQSSNVGHLSLKFKDLTYSYLLKEFQSKQVYVLSGHVTKVNYKRNHNYCLY